MQTTRGKTITISLSEEESKAAEAEPPAFPESAGGAAWETVYFQLFGHLPGQAPNPKPVAVIEPAP